MIVSQSTKTYYFSEIVGKIINLKVMKNTISYIMCNVHQLNKRTQKPCKNACQNRACAHR